LAASAERRGWRAETERERVCRLELVQAFSGTAGGRRRGGSSAVRSRRRRKWKKKRRAVELIQLKEKVRVLIVSIFELFCFQLFS